MFGFYRAFGVCLSFCAVADSERVSLETRQPLDRASIRVCVYTYRQDSSPGCDTSEHPSTGTEARRWRCSCHEGLRLDERRVLALEHLWLRLCARPPSSSLTWGRERCPRLRSRRGRRCLRARSSGSGDPGPCPCRSGRAGPHEPQRRLAPPERTQRLGERERSGLRRRIGRKNRHGASAPTDTTFTTAAWVGTPPSPWTCG